MTLPANSTLCTVFTLYFAGSPLIYSPAPRGTCSNCCPFREARDIQFHLYTRSNPTFSEQLFVSNSKILKASHFDTSHPMILYLHGFSESVPGGKGQSSQEIRDAFLASGDYNVVLVDWSPITALPWYMSTVDNIPRTAKYIARFLRFLIKSGASIKRMHLIGFSLGAEVAGFAGKQLQEWGLTLPRITGLDPAFPLFDQGSPHRRLAPSDAKFVDIIHTDGGLLGNPNAIGHADFYPNGGVPLQPGCVEQEIANNRWLGIIVGCSHQRSWQYFIESLKWPNAFRANRCERSKYFAERESCHADVEAFMGMGANKRLRGKFYLETNENSPFGKNL